MTLVAIVGATGKLGAQVVRVVSEMPDFQIVAKLDSKSSLEEIDSAELVIDVTRHDVSLMVAKRALSNGQKLLIGTSGWSSAAIDAAQLGEASGVVIIPNFSIGSMVATHLAGIASKFFENASISETHHISKIDSPSGTSAHTAEVIAQNRKGDGVATPASGDHLVAGVPITSHRLPDAIAEQIVTFEGFGEVVTIGHETRDRSSYDSGIRASVSFAATATGLTFGLDAVLGIK